MAKFKRGDEVRVRQGVEYSGGDENFVGVVRHVDFSEDAFAVHFPDQGWDGVRWYMSYELQPADVVALGEEN